jgi:hypothetical protein
VGGGFGGYYPWGFGGIGLGGYYGGYYPGYYDPWYGGYGGYGGYEPQYYSPTSPYLGGLRLKVKPKEASVYVDGYYAGIVDDFNGMFQKLSIEAGPHRVEIRAPGYETLVFDVRIEANQTTTFKGELQKIQ